MKPAEITPKKSTSQLLKKVGGVQYLRRHETKKTYYVVKRIGEKVKFESLETTDFELAKRKLKKWLEDQPVSNAGEIKFQDLAKKFLATKQGSQPAA